ncbi:MAG: Ig-like domain-containing protein, partial [Poseidonibacter sp.]|uniref:Ig-like domain-containing protein n=1 Tax=Poseidonibacter sp. TaxID=2321188 RepID=UPI00359CFF60
MLKEKKLDRKFKNTFKIDTLEPRILLSADPIVAAVQNVIIEETIDNTSSEETTTQTNNVIELEDLLLDPNSIKTILNIDNNDILKGTGTFDGTVTNEGTFSPGHSPGVVAINEDYTQTSDAVLEIEIGGNGLAGASDGFDQVNIAGNASFDGTLKVSILDDFIPKIGDTYTIMTYDSYDGFFNNGEGLYGFHSDYYFEIVQTDKKIDLIVREIVEGDLFEIQSPDLTEPELTTFTNSLGMLLNSDDFIQATESITFTGAVNIVDAYIASGTFEIGAISEKEINIVGEENSVTGSVITFSASDLDISIGADNFGFSLSDTDFSMALFNSTEENDNRSWLVSEGSTAIGSFTGLDFVDFTASNISLDLNLGLGDNNTSVVNLSGDNALTVGTKLLDNDGSRGEQISIDTTASLTVGDYFSGSGDFSIEKFSKEVTLSDLSTVDTDVFTIGGSNIDVFAGLNHNKDDELGLNAKNVEFGMAFLYEGTSVYSTMTAVSESTELVGIDSVTLSGQKTTIKKNSSSNIVTGTVVDFSANNMDIRTGNTSSITIDTKGVNYGSFDATIIDATMVAADFINVKGDFNLSMGGEEHLKVQAAMLDTDSIAKERDITASYISLSGTNVDIYAGLGTPYYGEGSKDDSVGLYMNDVSFSYTSYKQNLLSSNYNNMQFETFTSSAASAATVGMDDYLSVSLKDISISMNIGSSLNPLVDPYIDYKASFGESGKEITIGDSSIFYDFNQSIGIEVLVSNAHIEVDEFLYLDGAISFSKGTSLDATINNGVISTEKTSVTSVDVMTIAGYNLSGFSGIGGPSSADRVGIDIQNATFAAAIMKTDYTAPLHLLKSSFIAAKATVVEASLMGMEGAVTADFNDIEININRGNTALDASLIGPRPSIDFLTSTNGEGLKVQTGYKSDGEEIEGENYVLLDFSKDILELSVGYAEMSILGALQARGSVTLAKKSEEVYLEGDNEKTSVTTFSIGFKDAQAFIGIGDYFNTPNDAIGFAVDDLDLAAVLMKPTAVNPESLIQYFAVNANLQSAEIIGASDAIEISLSKFNFEANVSIINGYVGGILDPVVDFSRSGENDGIYKVRTGNELDFIELNYNSFLTQTSGHMVLSTNGIFEIDTYFDMKITENSFGLFIGDGMVSIGSDDTYKIAGVEVEGVIAINKDGLASKLKVNSGLDLGNTIDLDSNFNLTINTMGKEYIYVVPDKFKENLDYDQIIVSATPSSDDSLIGSYIELDGSATLDIAGAMEVSGDILVMYSASDKGIKQNIKLDGKLTSDFINSQNVVATMGMDAEGTFGALQIGGAIIQSSGFVLRGNYIVQFNNTTSTKTVRDIIVSNGEVVSETTYELGALGKRLAGDGEVSIAGQVSLKGPIDVSFSVEGLQGDVDLTLDLGGFGDTQVQGQLAILNTNEGPVFAMNANAELNIGADIVMIVGNGNVKINTSSEKEYAGVAANTILDIDLDADMYVSTFKLKTISGAITLEGSEFRAEINDAGFDFFGIAEADMSGYITSSGSFNFAMEKSFSVDLGPIWMKAGIDVELSDSGFKGSVWGDIGASVEIPYFYDFWNGKWLYKEFSASIGFDGAIEFSEIMAHVAAEIDIMGIKISGEETWYMNDSALPVLAEQSGGTLTLNIGDRASKKGEDYKDIINDKYIITSSGANSVTVSSLGVSTTYTGVTKIVGYAGEGNDYISVGSGVTAELDIDGGAGKDSFTIFSAASNSSVRGGDGDDYYFSLGHDVGRFYGQDGNDTFVGGTGNDIIDLGAGVNKAFGGAGNDTLIVNEKQITTFDGGSGNDSVSLTTTLDEFEINDYQFKSDMATLNFTNSLETFNIDNTSALLNIKGGNTTNFFGYTDINVKNSGDINLTGNSFNTTGVYSLTSLKDIDVNNSKFIAQNGTVVIKAASINGNMYTDLKALSVYTTSSTVATNLVINEKDDLNLVQEGINITKGSLAINIEILNGQLTLQEGVIKASNDITIVADDIDFISGANKISSSSNLNLKTMHSQINFRLGSTAESQFGRDTSLGDPNGYMNLSQRDLAALNDGFASINIGRDDAKIYLGDLTGSSTLTDILNLTADYMKVQGNFNSNADMYITVNNLEVSSQNVHDALGQANSGITASNLFLEIDEQLYVAGWLKGTSTLRININKTDGIDALFNDASGKYSFIGDSSGLLSANTLIINASQDMKIGSQINAKDLDIVAGGLINILDTGRIISNFDNSDINIQSSKALYVNGSVAAGASFDEDSGNWVENGINSNLTLSALGELKLSGAISVSGDLNLEGGSSQEDYALYFDTIPGKTITTIDLAYLNSVQNADKIAIAKLFEDNNITLGSDFTIKSIDSLKGFYDLTDAQKDKVAQSLGYVKKTGVHYFNPNAPADKQLITSLTSGDVLSKEGYTYYSGPVYIKVDSQEIETSFIQGQKADYSNLEIDWTGVTEPSINASFESLTLEQKEVVASHLGYSTRDGGVNWINLGADINDRYKTTFTQAAKIDYANDAMAWGDAGVPAANATFSSLTTAQKDVVANALGYKVYHNGVYVNFDAEASLKVVDSLKTGDYIINDINWGGVKAPLENATFGELSAEQREVVLKYLKFTEITGKTLLYNAQTNDLIESIDDYSFVTWPEEAGVKAPADGIPFSGLTKEQTAHVLKSMGYVEYTGTAYQNVEGKYEATFEKQNGSFSYENKDMGWSLVDVPDSTTPFESLSISQQELILKAIGYTRYETTIYYDADNENPNDKVRTDFELGVDYANKDINFGNVPLQQNRWLIDDVNNETKYIIYAEDINEDGKFETLKLQDAPKLTGQRGFGILMNGTLTTFKDNADLVFSSDKDVIFRGNVNILGDSSNLTLQSDSWVYAEGQFDVTGNITLLGGIGLDGEDLGGSNTTGDSVYIGKTTTLNTKEAGTTITIKGSKDVDILGAVVAGGVIGENGVTYAGVDSSVVIEAGEQVYVDTVLTASSNVTITTTGDLSEHDNGKSVILTKGAGLTTAGLSSHETNGGSISINATHDVSVMSMILSGGTKTKSTTTNGYDVTYSDKLSTLSIVSGGQAYIGGITKAKDGSMIEVGSTLTSTGSIYVKGGDSADGVSVRLPGTAKLITNDANSTITMIGSQNVNVSGVVVAGGEATDVYDDEGRLLGTQIEYFSPDEEKGEKGSSIIIEAGYQAKLQRSLYAGHLIDVRGGMGDIFAKENAKEGEELSLFVDQGVVIGSKVQLQTSQKDSDINLSSSGNLIITAPLWTQEIKAEGFSKNANGVLDEDVTLHIKVDIGEQILEGYVLLNALDTQEFSNLFDLKTYIEKQIQEFEFDVVFTADEEIPIGSTLKLDEQMPQISLALDDGRFMFVGDSKIEIFTDSTNAQLIGLTSETDYESSRAYAINASEFGSTVNIGREGVTSGDVTIAGKIIAYEGINFFSGEALDGFTQNVDITALAVIETLNGGMVIDPGASGTIYGTFIARGTGSNIEITTSDSIDIHGTLIAQENIIIKAGSEVKEGEVSIQTYGTGKIQTLSDGGTISLIGVNDVNIDTTIGLDGANLALVELGSTHGTLTLNKESGRIETSGQIKFIGKDLVLAGVIKSDYKTDVGYDYELDIQTDGDITISGTVDTKGSILISGGGNVEIFNTRLIADELGDKIEISAGKNLTLGTALANASEDAQRAVIIQANENLSLNAGETLNIGYDAQVYSMADNSSIDISAGGLNVVGIIEAGASVIFADTLTVEKTGNNANLNINSDSSLILGGKALDADLNIVDRGVNLIASGNINIITGADYSGVGMVISKLSSIRSTGSTDIRVDGSMQIDGLIKADGENANVNIKSDGMMFIDSLVYATNNLTIEGGTSEYGVGLYLEEFTFDEEGNRLTGGTLDTAVDGNITVGAYEDVYLLGVVGQLDEELKAKTSEITLTSNSGKINVYQNIDAKNKVSVKTEDLNLFQSTHIFTSQTNSSISIDASGEVYIEKAQDEENIDAQIKTYSSLDIKTNSLVMQGLINIENDDSITLINAKGDVAITGIISAKGSMTLNADDINITSQGKLDVAGDLDITATGEFNLDADASLGATKVILVPQFVTSEKTIKVPGGTQQVEDGTYTVKVSAGMTPYTYEKVLGYKKVDVGDQYFTMDIDLSQDGYYNKTTNTYKEFFIEGVDYHNSDIFSSTEVSSDYKNDDYKSWQQLSDDQQKTVLLNIGYKEAFKTSISAIIDHQTKDGVVSQTSRSANYLPWYGETKQWVTIDVDGFRDKSLYIEPGLQDYILSAVFKSKSSSYTETVGSYIDNAEYEIEQVFESNNGYSGEVFTKEELTWADLDSGGSNSEIIWDSVNVEIYNNNYYKDDTRVIKYTNISSENTNASNLSAALKRWDGVSGYYHYSNYVVGHSSSLYETTYTDNEDWKSFQGDVYKINYINDNSSQRVIYDINNNIIESINYAPKDTWQNGSLVNTDVDFDELLSNKYDYRETALSNINEMIANGNSTLISTTISQQKDTIKTTFTNSSQINEYQVWDSKGAGDSAKVWSTGTDYSSYNTTRYVYSDLTTELYAWQDSKVYISDKRDDFKFSITTQNQDIYDNLEIRASFEELKESFVDSTVTLWKTVSVPEVEQTVQFTELKEVEGQGRSVAQFGSKSINATNITLNINKDVNIKGAIEASENFVLNTDGSFNIEGMITQDGDGNDIELLSKIDAGSLITITSAKDINLADKSALELTDANGVINLDAKGSMLLDGEVIAGGTVTVNAGSDIEMKSIIKADQSISIEVSNSSKVGSITTNEEVILKTTNLTLSAGDNAGELRIVNSILEASDTLTLNANAAKVIQTDSTISADKLYINANDGVSMNITANTINVKNSGSGDINITNFKAVVLEEVETVKGSIYIEAYGDITATSVKALGGSNRDDITLTAIKEEENSASIIVGTIEALGEGDVTLNAVDSVTKDIGTIKANQLTVKAGTQITLNTDVDIITFENSKENANVSINQIGTKEITFDGVKVANGTLDITAAGSVVLENVEMLSDTKNVSVNAQGNISINSLVAKGSIVTLTSGANIYETTNDETADIIAKELILSANNNIDTIEVSIDKLTAISTLGDITISDLDTEENTSGLMLANVVANGTINILAQNNILTQSGSQIKADTIKLQSEHANIDIVSGSSFEQTKGVSIIAREGMFSMYQFFSGTELTQYESSKDFQFGNQNATLGNISSDTVILKTNGTIKINGNVTAKDLVVLEAGDNVFLWGIKGSSGNVDKVEITAKGQRDIKVEGVTVTGGNIVIANGINAGTGLEADEFEIRAKNDIFINVNDDFYVNGFMGGLEGFEASQNITITAGTGNLNIDGSIIKANESVFLQGTNINSDASSVFIAKDLKAIANGNIKLNTMVDTIELDSLVSGDVSILEADDITIKRADVHDGFFKITAGGNIFAQIVRTHVDDASNDIILQATGTISTGNVAATTQGPTGQTTGTVTATQNISATDSSIYMKEDWIVGGEVLSGNSTYTVIKLPIKTEEFTDLEPLTIKSGTGVNDDLTIIAPIDIGIGHLILESGGGIGLGEKITAQKLTASLKDDITIESQLDNLDLRVSGTGNVTVSQTGDLIVDRLETNGGNVSFFVDGNVTFNDVIGSAKSFTVTVTDGHSIVVNGQTYNAGTTTFTAVGGTVIANINMTTLDLTSSGDIDLTDSNGFILDSYVTTDRTNDFSINSSSGTTTINANISREGDGALTLNVGALTLNESLHSNDALNITAVGDIILGEYANITTSDDAISLHSTNGAIILDNKSSINSGSAQITLEAQNDISVGKLFTTSAEDLTITSHSGAILDSGNGAIDIDAQNAKLVLSAVNGIGSSDALETNVVSLELTNTTSGDINITDLSDTEIVKFAQNGAGGTIKNINGDMIVSEVTGGSSSVIKLETNNITLNGAITTAGAGVEINANKGDIVLSNSILVNGAGDIKIKALTGSIVTNIDDVQWLKDGDKFSSDIYNAITSGEFTVDISTGEILTKEGKVLHTSNGLYFQTTSGDMELSAFGTIGGRTSIVETQLSDGETSEETANRHINEDFALSILINANNLTINSINNEAINVLATSGINISSQTTKEGIINVYTLSGEQSIETALDAGEKDIVFVANDISIKDIVTTTGDLQIGSLNPDTDYRFGSTQGSDKEGEFTIDFEENKLLSDSIQTINIGEVGTKGDISFGDDLVDGEILDDEEKEAKKIVVNSDLIITTEGKTFVNSALEANSIKLYGPHYTLALNDDLTSLNELEIHDSLKVGGDNSITAGSYIVLTSDEVEFIQGDSKAGDDILNLNANSGNITIAGNVGAAQGTQFDGADVDNLEGFSIIDLADNSAGAIDVSFAQDFYVDGDVTIYATGDVVFTGVVNITGSLNIIGANSITFASSVSVTNDMNLEANEIDFNDVVGSVDVNGDISFKATDINRAVLVDQDTIKSNALNIDNDDMLALQTGYTGISFGKLGGGDVKLSTDIDFNSNLGLYGASIDIQSSADEFVIGGDVTIGASKNVILSNSLLASGDVEIKTTEGKIKLESSQLVQADDLILEAKTGIVMTKLDVNSLSAINSGSGAINLNVIATSGDVTVTNLKQLDASSNGDITLKTENGSITMAGATTAGSGDVRITANSTGAMASIVNTSAISTTTGLIVLDVVNDITIGTNSDVSTTGYGTITLTANKGTITQNSDVTTQGALVTYTAGADIIMDGDATTSTFDAASNSSKVQFNAAGDIKLGSVGADGFINLVSGGAITDNSTSHENILNLFGETTIVTLNAKNGIGGSGDNDLDTNIASISSVNTISGGTYIQEKNDLILNSGNIISKGDNGTISIDVLDGSLKVVGEILNSADHADVILQTQESDESTDSNIQINTDIQVAHGNLTIISSDSITNVVDNILSTEGVTYSIVIKAQDSINLQSGTEVKTTSSGTVFMEAISGNISFDHIETTKAVISAGGNIINTDSDIEFDIEAKELLLKAGGSIDAIESDIEKLSVSSGAGDFSIVNAKALEIGSVTLNEFTQNGVVTVGNINIETPETLTFDTISTTGNVNITATELLNYDTSILRGDIVTVDLSGENTTFGTSDTKVTTEIRVLNLNYWADDISIDELDDIIINTYTADKLIIKADDVTLNLSATNSAIGTEEKAAFTDVTSLTATVGDGIIYIKEVDDITLDITQSQDSSSSLDLRSLSGSIILNSHLNTQGNINYEADELTINADATNMLGTLDKHATTSLNKLSGTSFEDIYINEADSIELNFDSAKSVNIEIEDGSVNVLKDLSISDDMSIVTTGGSSDIIFNGTLAATNSNIVLEAGKGIIFNDDVTLIGTDKTLDAKASTDDITVVKSITTENSFVSLVTNSNINLGVINVGTADVKLTQHDVIDTTLVNNVISDGLILTSNDGIGTNEAALTFNKDIRLSLSTNNGDINVVSDSKITFGTDLESDSIYVNNSKNVNIEASEIAFNTSDEYKDINAVGNGSVTLKATNGSIITKEEIQAGSGVITLEASKNIEQNSDIRTTSTNESTITAAEDYLISSGSVFSSYGDITVVADELKLGTLSTRETLTITANSIQESEEFNSTAKLTANTLIIKSADITAENIVTQLESDLAEKVGIIESASNKIEENQNIIDNATTVIEIANQTISNAEDKIIEASSDLDIANQLLIDAITQEEIDAANEAIVAANEKNDAAIISKNEALASKADSQNSIDAAIIVKNAQTIIKTQAENEKNILESELATAKSKMVQIGKVDNLLEVKYKTLIETEATKNGYLLALANPSIEISSSTQEYTNKEFEVKISFSDVVYGFDINDINVSNASIVSGLTTVDNINYYITLKPEANSVNEITVSVNQDVAQDIDGFNNTAANDFVINSDTVLPTVKIYNDGLGSVSSVVNYTFEFSEAVYGFDVNDIVVVNGTVSGNFVSGKDGDKVYKISITPNEDIDGNLSVYLKEGCVLDIAGNKNVASAINSLKIDNKSVYKQYGNM